MKRISKATREEAIEGCEAIAADRFGGITAAMAGEYGGDGLCSADDAACILAECAFATVRSLGLDIADGWAEAAALLRGDDEHEPWSPGHEVYLLNTETRAIGRAGE